MCSKRLDSCVLSANSGDTDEPTALHPTKCVSGLLCPDGINCAADPTELAWCTTGRTFEQPAWPPVRALGPGPRCNLTGTWSCGGVSCQITEAGFPGTGTPAAVSVTTNVKGFAWQTGAGTVTTNGTIALKYDIQPPRNPYRAGTIDQSCRTIVWNDTSVWTCDSCPTPLAELLDVHIIAHTHDDTGYLSTVQEYYDTAVESILTTVTAELDKNPARRFTYVEIAFFSMWWEKQSEPTKQLVRRLVAEGQLDFSNGGWCMPDEASPTYHDLLSNMQKGLRLIEREFGQDARPRVAWSIDPFGHSSTYAALNAMFGFDFSVVGRIDFQEKAARFATKSMEMVWRPSRSASGSSRDIMTHVLDPLQFYSYPPGLNFEGDRKAWITPDNIEQTAQNFATFLHQKREGYATNSLLVPFGSDFQFANATTNFYNMDLLMAYMNTPENMVRFGLRLQYSTPALYMKALHSYDAAWPVKVDDFESYAIGPDQFLVGFYSSRPDYKGFIRQASSQLRAANVALTNLAGAGATAAGRNGTAGRSLVDPAAEVAALDLQASALGIAQHHDAITSSQRRHVHRDYIRQLSDGQVATDGSICRTIGATIAAASGPVPELVTCPYINESSCPAATDGSAFAVVLVNPTARPMHGTPIRIPVPGPVKVATAGGGDGAVPSQLLAAWPAGPFIHGGTDQPPRTVHPPSPTVAFLAYVAPLGTTTYIIRPTRPAAPRPEPATSQVNGNNSSPPAGFPAVLDNGLVQARFNAAGMLASITKAGVTVGVAQSLRYYIGGDGVHNSPYRSQGATGSGNYIFQPDSNMTYPFPQSGVPVSVTVGPAGPVVHEVRQVLVPGSIEQVFRLYNGSDTLEVEYRIGPIDVSDGVGKEVISHFATDIDSGATFLTDVNGMQSNTRTRNARATLWPGGPTYFNQTDAVAGNYFAVNSVAAITDRAITGRAGRRFSVLVDRAEGGASLASGALELMLHRRLAHGCRWGMCENGEAAGLNDTLGAEVVIRHRLSVDQVGQDGSSTALTRARARELNFPPSMLFGKVTAQWPHAKSTSPLASAGGLPQNLELTTWQLLDDGSTLLRLTHIFPVGEHPVLSAPASVDLCTLFGAKLCAAMAAAGPSSFAEMNAAGDVPLESVSRLSWKVIGEDPGEATTAIQEDQVPGTPAPGPSMVITVAPADTRTFKILI